ncbi:uncharacterized protein PHACADRAFT_260310 [Phanerochaete carnosa HHB-10118-sp]|uniref:Uncharacterized protein n=1 Tax=Phanerochaete carnosa (strain HHB-10118-sp) TaxID=650164 RepID=K5VQR6_PHACS|nr:uncharacterized protein PHACADRAFT_260310 [Phanerochaete carnosa HHB-10118-sp]EKM53788.1 hypothetical protein PHACADRAFT_260310 [Phanerochaete carnosa HHB-10118-sp]
MSIDLSPTPQSPADTKLPEDLVNIIVDLFQDDSHALKTLCLVHRAWLSKARKHLFRDITVQYKMTWAFGTKSIQIPGIGEKSMDKSAPNQDLWMSLFSAFLDFLTRAPTSITESIRQLSLLGKDWFSREGDNRTDWTAEEYQAWTISLTTDAVHTLLRLLPNLSELRLHLDLHQSSKTIPTDRFHLRTLSLDWCLASTDCIFFLMSLLPELHELLWAVWERTPQNTPLRLLNATQQLFKDAVAKLKRRQLLRRLSRVVVRREPQQIHGALLELLEAACNLKPDEERPAISLDLCMALSSKDDVARYRRLFKNCGHYVTRLTVRPTRTKDDITVFKQLIQEDVGLSYCNRLRRLHLDVSIYWRTGVSICVEEVLRDFFRGKHSQDSPESVKLVLSLDHSLAFTFGSEATLENVDGIVTEYRNKLREVVVAEGGNVPDEDKQQQVILHMPRLVEARLLCF